MNNPIQKPSIGRIVHYCRFAKEPPYTGLIMCVHPGEDIDLMVFYPTGAQPLFGVRYSKEYQNGHWSWPPIIDEV